MFPPLVSGDRADGLRPLNPTRDLGGLARLIEQSFGDELSEGGEHVLHELRMLDRMGPLSLLVSGVSSEVDGLFNGFVWQQDGRVVGNVTLSRPTGHARRWQISNVAVLEAYRGQGIGRRLVEAAIDLILRRGGHTAYLYVRENNLAAVHLYESLGFVEVDRTTDCKYVPSPAGPLRSDGPAGTPVPDLRLLRQLGPREGELLFDLAAQASGAGQRWLSPVRRRQFVRSPDERFFRRLSSLFVGEVETFWGAFTTQRRLRAGLSLRATRAWNPKPHHLKLWVHPGYRGQVEDALTGDVMSLLARQSRRLARVSLPACESRAIEALLGRGFVKVRTLVLMKLEL